MGKPRRQESYQQAVVNQDLQEDLPDLNDPEMAKAADVIQSVFKGFTQELQAATDKIQSECQDSKSNGGKRSSKKMDSVTSAPKTNETSPNTATLEDSNTAPQEAQNTQKNSSATTTEETLKHAEPEMEDSTLLTK